MTTISISLPDISGEAGPFSIWLRKRSDRAIVNTGGDALTEIEVASVKTGVWSASVAETIPGEDCYARIYEGTTETTASIIAEGILYDGQTEVGKESAASGGLSTEQANQLAGIATAIAGGAVESSGRIAQGGAIVAYIGDDFKVRSGTALTIPVSDPAGGIYTKLTALTPAKLKFGVSAPGKAAGLITGTVASITQTGSGASQLCNLTIEVTNCGASLPPGDQYFYQIEQEQTHSSETDDFVEIEGKLKLKQRAV